MTEVDPDVHSTANRRVKAAAGLSRRKERDQQGRYLIEGPRYVADLIGGGDIVEVFATPEAAAQLPDAPVPVTTVTDEVLDKLADSVTPQGVVAVARQRRAELEDVVGTGTLVVLCGVSDPGNAGAIVRTATAAGAAGVVFARGSVDPWNPKAVRASAGSVARVPLVVDVDPRAVIGACRARGQRCLALDPSADVDVERSDVLSPPVAMFFGNEAHGLDVEVLRAVDLVARVPVYGPVESLNLAAAVAVAVYAAARVTRGQGTVEETR
ncbi:MAG: RNA methyltransferase [Actinobacteria bacterium]|nr:RNA methyltransferase [Actinomycetota bacterium]